MEFTKKDKVISVYFDDVYAGWEQWFMLSSDRHHDHITTDWEYELLQLELAKKRNALILDGGDLFDAMQGPHDKRAGYDALRPQYKIADYFGEIVRDAAKFYTPFADNWLMLGKGNHETGVLRNNAIDLTSMLGYEMQQKTTKPVYVSGYDGWVRFMFKQEKKHLGSYTYYYSHGKGGDAPVTKGMIETARQGVYLPDANIVHNGHNHENYVSVQKRLRLSSKGIAYEELQYYVRTPGYKRGWQMDSGFDVEKLTPKPCGIVWLHLFYDERKTNCVNIELTPAVE